MRGTWNPTRRNRNIGTSKAGLGKNNRLVIPECWWDSTVYWEKLSDYELTSREINGRKFHFIIEPTTRDHIHSCTVNDVAHLLRHIPLRDLEGIGLFIFRQPKRKEQILTSVWGRIGFNVKIDKYTGPAIILEAVNVTKPMYWEKSLTPDQTLELERLRQDGHSVTLTNRGYTIEMSADSCRSTQLYRTLLHELGHRIQWREMVIRSATNGSSFQEFSDKYYGLPVSEREMFANNYAATVRKRLASEKVVPFPKIQ